MTSTRVAVRVTFMRMDQRQPPPRPLPPDTTLVRLAACSVPFYRYLYGTVGGPYLWWLRRTLSDAELASILRNPAVSVHVLYQGGEPAGFFELDNSPRPTINLSYFGLMPHAVGRGLGAAFLGAAIETAWRAGARALTVNTCTADHERALPNYLRAGFYKVRVVDEVWDIPARLGLTVPVHLRTLA
ncbi:MAG: GNAT family N-acetyltransferase [Acetobacteraceae bacterium]|nr:GNAT family N-acetyltransferase [Acetobacteraceae bacterium]